MYRCERCGTGFNPTVASALESCPRCQAQGVAAPLSFRLFEKAQETAPPQQPTTTEEPA
jgi:predicted  nucleic acid-binding Zn-ribbon protein